MADFLFFRGFGWGKPVSYLIINGFHVPNALGQAWAKLGHWTRRVVRGRWSVVRKERKGATFKFSGTRVKFADNSFEMVTFTFRSGVKRDRNAGGTGVKSERRKKVVRGRWSVVSRRRETRDGRRELLFRIQRFPHLPVSLSPRLPFSLLLVSPSPVSCFRGRTGLYCLQTDQYIPDRPRPLPGSSRLEAVVNRV